MVVVTCDCDLSKARGFHTRNAAMTKTLNPEQLDRACLEILETVQELHEQKTQLHQLLSNGYLCMSKARYVMGVKSISKMQYGNEMKATSTIDVSSDDDNSLMFKVNNENSEVNYKSNTPEARKRNAHTDVVGPDFDEDEIETVGAQTANAESNRTEAISKRKPHDFDPLKWFGILVPQSLRQSQAHFKNAVRIIADISTLQSKLETLKNLWKNCVEAENI